MGRSTPLPAAAPTPTRVRREGGEYVGPGDITLAGGVGMALRDGDPGEIVLDAPAADPEAPAGLYVPATASWPSTTLALPTGTRYLTRLEALIAGTTPAAGTDSNNCRAIRARGSSSGQQDLRLATVGGREYRWSADDVVTLGDQTDATFAPAAERGFLFKLNPTADLRVKQVGLRLRNASHLTAGKNRVYEILNAARTTVLASTEVQTDEAATDTMQTYPLIESVDLDQAQDYWVGVRIIGGTGEFARLQLRASDASPIFSGSLAAPPSPHSYYLSRNDEGDWINPTLGLVNISGDVPGGGTLRLTGSPGGVLIGGNLILESVAFGAPPSNPDAVNVRLQWATEID